MEPECYKYACIKLSPACLRASVWNAKTGASDCQVPSLHLDTFLTGRLANASCVECRKGTPRSHPKHTSIPRKDRCLCLCPLGQGRRGRIKNNKPVPQPWSLHPVTPHRHFWRSSACRKSLAISIQVPCPHLGYMQSFQGPMPVYTLVLPSSD